MEKYYAGVGSRETPKKVLDKMTYLASVFRKAGYVLNSGGANGADSAFEDGALDQKQIFLPWNGYNGRTAKYKIYDEAYEIASKLHPNWERLKDSVRALMARNTHQVLGVDLKTPVDFLLCWTADACISHETRTPETGGTGLAISIACTNGIPIFNLADEFHHHYVFNILTTLAEKS